MNITVWVDGSGTTGGPAGIGFYATWGELVAEGNLSIANATNQQAELLAAAWALHTLPRSDVTVISDSEYVVKGWNERRRRRANVRHWERLERAVSRHRSVTFEWTRGHAGTHGNERADELARAARLAAGDGKTIGVVTPWRPVDGHEKTPGAV